MYCKNCGNEFNGKFCPACGTPAPTSAETQHQNPVVAQQGVNIPVSNSAKYKTNKPIYKKAWFWIVIAVVVLGIIIGTKSCKKNIDKSDPWPKTGLGAMLPEPPGVIKIQWDKEDSFWADAKKLSDDNYREYLEKCIELGYVVDAKNTSGNYDAFNEQGYKLSLRKYTDELKIQIDAPIIFETLRWPKIADDEKVPRPDSNLGNTNYEYSDHFSLYVGETSFEQFNSYVEKCMEAGFIADYERGNDYYRATNDDGYRLNLFYRGFNTIKIDLDQPKEPDPTEPPETIKPTDKPVTDAPAITDTPEKPTSTPASEKDSFTVGESEVTFFQNSIGTNWIRVVVPVKNTGNTNLYMSSSSIDLEYSDGTLAKAFKNVSVYPQIVKPGETAYYYEETTIEETVTADGLKVVPHVKAAKAKVDLIRFEVSEAKIIKDEWFGPKMTGRVKNTGDKADSLIYVVANFFDGNGKLIGQQFTILTDELAAGEKVGFETSALTSHFDEADVASFEVVAFPYQYQF